jgi:hypothetical protein
MAASREALFVVFDGPPGPEAGRFVELETPDRRSVGASAGAEWAEDTDRGGLWLLGPFDQRIREVKPYLPAEGVRDYQWPQPPRPIRVLVATKPLPEGNPLFRTLPYRLVADADYVLSLGGGVLKDLDGLFVDRPNIDGGAALHELALQGPVEYVRWPA